MPEDSTKKDAPMSGDAPKDPFEGSGLNAQGIDPAPQQPDGPAQDSSPSEPAFPAAGQPMPAPQEVAADKSSQDGFTANGPSISPEPTAGPAANTAAFGAAATATPSVTPSGMSPAGATSTAMPSMPAPMPGPSTKKKWLIPVLIAVGIAVIAAALVGFKAYTSSPGYVWNKSIENTQKAYQTLDDHLQKTAEFKGSTATGSLSLASEGFEVSGDFEAKSAGQSADVAIDFSVSSSNQRGDAIKISAGADFRVISSDGAYPDLYIRARDLDKAASMLDNLGVSSSEASSWLSQYNNQWYVIEGSYLEQTASAYSGGLLNVDGGTSQSSQELYKLFGKLGKLTSEYVFSNDDSKAVIVQKEFVGKEDKHGRATYHYKAEINTTGLKAYGQALKKTLAEDAIARSLMSAKDKADAEALLVYLDDLSKEYKNDKVTIDVWVDSGTKLVQTIRLSDAKNSKSYVELSQLYDANDKIPLQLVVSGDGTNFTAKLTVDTKKNENTYDIKATSSGSTITINATESFSQTAPTIEKPTNAKSVQELFGSYLGASTQSPVQSQLQNQLLMQ
ncbi:MAG: hypothetical protein WBP26_01195 [Candidatus Saccharimonadales bacterium]